MTMSLHHAGGRIDARNIRPAAYRKSAREAE